MCFGTVYKLNKTGSLMEVVAKCNSVKYALNKVCKNANFTANVKYKWIFFFWKAFTTLLNPTFSDLTSFIDFIEFQDSTDMTKMKYFTDKKKLK